VVRARCVRGVAAEGDPATDEGGDGVLGEVEYCPLRYWLVSCLLVGCWGRDSGGTHHVEVVFAQFEKLNDVWSETFVVFQCFSLSAWSGQA
jgi:hypothetical protein